MSLDNHFGGFRKSGICKTIVVKMPKKSERAYFCIFWMICLNCIKKATHRNTNFGNTHRGVIHNLQTAHLVAASAWLVLDGLDMRADPLARDLFWGHLGASYISIDMTRISMTNMTYQWHRKDSYYIILYYIISYHIILYHII